MASSDVALVTGGGRGIGAAIARALAQAGATVIVADVDPVTANEVATSIGDEFGVVAAGFQLDVADRASCNDFALRTFGNFGNISILINNAGVNRRMPIADSGAAAAWDQVMSVNVNGAFNITDAFREQLQRTRGAIVNIASIQSFVHLNNAVAYSASKGAISQFTKAMAVELAPYGVRVNAVAPGLTQTEMTAPTRANAQRMTSLMDRIPLKRFADPSEIAAPVAFLTSPAASYITGAILVVDGGYLAL